MNQVRIHGDPFGDCLDSSRLRSFLRLSLGCGMRCALSLSGVRARPPLAGERLVPLTDGQRDLSVGTQLPPAEIDMLLRAAGENVAATAPVVVFAPSAERADLRLFVGLEWPAAAAIVVANEAHTPTDLLERVRAEARWAGSENPPHALTERELQTWLALPTPPATGPIVHIGSLDAADGTDLVLAAWPRHATATMSGLRLVVPAAEVSSCRDRVRESSVVDTNVQVIAGPFEPAHARDAIGVLLPMRRLRDSRVLVQALASGRAVAVSRWPATAAILGRHGTCLPIGGRCLRTEGQSPAQFAPEPRALAAALDALGRERAEVNAIGARARRHVIENLVAGRPALPPATLHDRRRGRPTLVLEAPFFETSSSAELSIETARALRARDQVDLLLVPNAPFRHDLAALRRRAPELIDCLVRQPGSVDLWLSSGWPVRADRPDCRVHALRVDWEYGALPIELLPHVNQTADLVVVHSDYVQRTLLAAGRPSSSIRLVPHGVDAAMHPNARADRRILDFKGDRAAVLFCGGLIWRKGIDAFLGAALAAYTRRQDFVLVIKSVGHDQHYGRFHLRELVEKCRRTPGAPPVLLLTEELSRDQLASVYTACDVLLHPYRGEGFGLPVLEARACGLPVLVTQGGGADGLLAGPGATPIPAERRPVELPAPHLSMPWVLEPSVPDATRLLHELLDDLPARRAAAARFAPAVGTTYTWNAAAEQLEQMAFAALGESWPSASVPATERLVTLPSVVNPAVPVLQPVR